MGNELIPVQAWQEGRNKAKAAEEAAKEAEEAQAAKWSLEDDFEEDEGAPGPSRASRKAPQEGSDEIDPLEAFMNQNAESLNPPARPKSGNLDEAQAPADEEDEIDPLDAYMDAQVNLFSLQWKCKETVSQVVQMNSLLDEKELGWRKRESTCLKRTE